MVLRMFLLLLLLGIEPVFAHGDEEEQDDSGFRHEIGNGDDEQTVKRKEWHGLWKGGKVPPQSRVEKDISAAVECREKDLKTDRLKTRVGLIHLYSQRGSRDVPAILFKPVEGVDTLKGLKDLDEVTIRKERRDTTFSPLGLLDPDKPVRNTALYYHGSEGPFTTNGDGTFIRYFVRDVKNPDTGGTNLMIKIERYKNSWSPTTGNHETQLTEAFCM